MKIAIGSANFGNKYGLFGIKKFTKKEILKTEKIANKSHIEYIDTAHDYKDSEKIIGDSKLRKLRIITKIRIPRKNILKIETLVDELMIKSLKRLRKNKIDTLLIHNLDDLFGRNGAEFLNAVKSIKKRGFVNNIGVSIYEPEELDKLWKFWKPDVVQAPLNVLDQRILRSGWLNKLKKNNIKFFARSCFLQGILIGNFDKLNISKNFLTHLNEFKNWCETNNISRLKACLDFVRQFKNVYCIVLGFDDTNQLGQIINELKKKNKKITRKFSNNNLKYIDPRKWK